MAAKRKKAKSEKPVRTSSVGFTEIEMKLLRLALDKGAYEGEADNAAVMFIRKLRERNMTVEELFGQASQTSPLKSKCGNEVMTFGKYKGEMIKDVPQNYLIWVLNTCTNIDPRLRLAIHTFLTED